MSGTQGPSDDVYDAEGYDESQRAEILEVTGDGPDDGSLLTDINPDLGGSEDDDDDLDELSMADDEIGEEDDDADEDEDDLDEDDIQDDFDDEDVDEDDLDEELDDPDDVALRP
ncbi:DNA primase [uncultured Sphingomonas sp.]|uniref:DNA primase n=1 Tax=uncultured Sphingomonas sp. TaxID=158754 RepID=UPI0025DAD994|nr:DNA primase [uncultured Sphingomonas sp.]